MVFFFERVCLWGNFPNKQKLSRKEVNDEFPLPESHQANPGDDSAYLLVNSPCDKFSQASGNHRISYPGDPFAQMDVKEKNNHYQL
ncbi:hypothetical protein C5L33_000860 [Lactobacillus pasteurii]|nr:hypothetical protein C5L33_000860 [Lactobacillus pasteurii]